MHGPELNLAGLHERNKQLQNEISLRIISIINIIDYFNLLCKNKDYEQLGQYLKN